jgi:CMP-N-acetylneuraminic acid synthetase
MKNVIATICARGGSKGLPGKNSNILLGKPLISYTIEQALACDFISHVIVSTDDGHIAKIAEQAGAQVPFMRPPELALDDTPKRDVILHAVKEWEKLGVPVDVVIDLDVTSPLRDLDDIYHCYQLLTAEVDLVITGYKSNKNPYFNMVESKADGFVALSKQVGQTFASRQTTPPVYAMNASIYVWHRHTLERGLWDNPRIKLYEMPENRSIDIDTPVDWQYVEILMKEKSHHRIEQET